MNEIINVENVSRIFKVSNCETIFDYLKGKGFKKKKEIIALEDINFQIKKGEFVGLLGINGAGKSTLIKLMTGILMPTKGTIRVFNNDPFLKRISNSYKIGAVFGQRCQLRWDISPLESYQLFQAIYNIPDNVYQDRLNELISILSIENILLQPVRTLSLGQKMKAELVGAFLHQPEVLFLDEPTLGLDIVSKEAIIQFLCKCKEKGDTTIIFTTHDMEDVKKLCERLIIIQKGKMLIDDRADNIIQNTPLNSSVLFKSELGDFCIPESIEHFKYEKTKKELLIKNVEEKDIAFIISEIYKINKICQVDIKKPEFKDIFMNLFEEDK